MRKKHIPRQKEEQESPTLVDVVASFDRWLHLEDSDLIYVVLATAVVCRLPGDPVWPIIVGASSSGKTETLASISGLEGVRVVSTITESGLLSGTARQETSESATGGLLR